MEVRLAVLTLASLAVLAQQGRQTSVVGTIEKVSSREVQVNVGAQSLAFRIGSDTKVWKGRIYNDLAVLKVGDEVSVHAVEDAAGALAARSISVQKITIRAFVRKVDRASSTIVAAPETDSTRTGEASSRVVHYFPNTASFADLKGLAVGHEVLVVGLTLQNGDVDATRVTVYNTDLPMRK